MSFNVTKSFAGDVAAKGLEEAINEALRSTAVEGEHDLIRKGADMAHAATVGAFDADHHIEVSISGSITDNQTAFQCSTRAVRTRNKASERKPLDVAPWKLPKKS